MTLNHMINRVLMSCHVYEKLAFNAVLVKIRQDMTACLLLFIIY